LDAKRFVQALSDQAHAYNPFNLVVFDGNQLMGFESRHARCIALEPGIGALSNADFETPWPKLTQLKEKLKAQVGFNTTDTQSLIRLLRDTTVASDDALPNTGVPRATERALSATFVKMPGYGTRACSVVHLHHNHTEFYEEVFDETGLIGTSIYQFSRKLMY
jgi:uncharacterized protein with NRDE domain